MVICISNTHINLYLCTQCLHERLHIVVFILDLCPKEIMEDSRGWGNYENLFILYISNSQMNSAVTIAGLMNIALPFMTRLDIQLEALRQVSSFAFFTYRPSMLCLGVRSVVFATIVQHLSN